MACDEDEMLQSSSVLDNTAVENSSSAAMNLTSGQLHFCYVHTVHKFDIRFICMYIFICNV